MLQAKGNNIVFHEKDAVRPNLNVHGTWGTEKGYGRATWIHGFVQMLKSQQENRHKAKPLPKAD
jgi:hypothetical protein